MQTRYQTLLDELHTNKRELSNYRQKYLAIENQSLAVQQENRSLKKMIARLKQNCQKLTEQNKFLTSEKEALLNDYSTSVESIKEQITKKQQEIHLLKQNSFSPLMNQKLLEKQIRCDVEKEFQGEIQNKQQRIRDLSQQIQKLLFDKAVDKQKNELRIEALQKQLKEMQNSHMIELQNYANKIYQNSQSSKITEEAVLIKKLKREIDQLRTTLDHTEQQLNESISQKSKLQKQYSTLLVKHRNEVQNHANELRALQFDNQRAVETKGQNNSEKELTLVRTKQKQVKGLKEKNQTLHEEIDKKNVKISELEIELVNQKNQLKRAKEFHTNNQSDLIQTLKLERESLQRQIKELKHVNENVRKHNIEILNQVSEMNIKSVKNLKQNMQSRQDASGTKQSKKQSKKNIIVNQNTNIENEQLAVLNDSFGKIHRVKSSTNLNSQNHSSKLALYQNKYEEEVKRNKQLGLKYVQLKKKFNALDLKFKQANTKLVELLKDKIHLGSPTAASNKKFQFTASNQKYFQSPSWQDKQIETNFKNDHMWTQPVFSPQARNLRMSPQKQQTKGNRKEKSRQAKGERSFYQKSLKIKNSHKFKQLKCLNHDDVNQDHSQCSHSPLKSS